MKLINLIGVSALFMSSSAFACSCADHSLINKWTWSKNVFLAEITEVKVVVSAEDDGYNPGLTHGYYKVIESYKGSSENVPYFTATHIPKAFCQDSISEGEVFLVFTDEGPVNYDMCSLTNSWYLEDDVEILRQFSKNEPLKKYKGIYRSRDGRLAIDGDIDTVSVAELELNDHEYYKVSFKGYELSGGEVFAVEIIDAQPVTASQYSVYSGEVQFEKVYVFNGGNGRCNVVIRNDDELPKSYGSNDTYFTGDEEGPDAIACRHYIDEPIQYCTMEGEIRLSKGSNSCYSYKSDQTTVLVNEAPMNEQALTACAFRCVK